MDYEGEDTHEYLYNAQIPVNVVKSNHLRACLICGLVKEPHQFRESGCENCGALVDIDRSDFLDSCTTPNFEGFLAITQPQTSWVAKWQRISMFTLAVLPIQTNTKVPNFLVVMQW